MSTQWVLVIDDDCDIREILSKWLEDAGFKVVSADGVPEGMVKLDNQRFDCVLLDMNLGKHSGEQILEYMDNQRHGKNADTPVLLASGNLHAELVVKLKGRVTTMLVKPFQPEMLVERVSAILAAGRATIQDDEELRAA